MLSWSRVTSRFQCPMESCCSQTTTPLAMAIDNQPSCSVLPMDGAVYLVHFQQAPMSSTASRCLSRVVVAQQAPGASLGLLAMNTMTDWQPLSGLSGRTGSLANSLCSAQATSALCSGP